MTRLEVPQHSVDPFELLQTRGLRWPTTSARWVQSASVTGAEHARPSLSTSAPGARLARAHFEIALGLADKADREKPPRQQQLGAAEQRTGSQRGLAMAGVTWVQATAAIDHDAVGC